MSKPHIHAESSARRFGGKPEDYLAIHQFMDSSKSVFPDNRHRALTHNSWFIGPNGPLELAFGVTFANSDGKKLSVREIGEQHILEDFGGRFIPSAADYLNEMEMKTWMNNGRKKSCPPSHERIQNKLVDKTHTDIIDSERNLID
jgi:hypothetical protein